MEHELTRDDVQALRRARDILFKADSSGRAKIVAILEKRDDDFSEVEQRIFPEQAHHTERRERTIFPEGGGAPKIDGKEAFGHAHLMLCHYDPRWQTIASILKPGDRVYTNFHADAWQNNYLKSAVTETNAGRYENIHVDHLVLVVYRGDEKLEFLVDISMCPDNSARMIQPYGSVMYGTTQLTPEKVFPEHPSAVEKV